MSRVLVIHEIRNRRGIHLELLKNAGLEAYSPELSLMKPDVLLKHLDGVSAVLAGMEPFNPEVLAQAKDLRVIARVGVGYDAVDVPAATKHNIAVTTTPGTNEHSVAELTIAMLTGIYRGYPFRDRLSGRTLGLVGLGRIGRAIVPRAQGLGLKVIAYDPFPNSEYAQANQVKLCTFPELLAEADIVSLHLPATAETRNLINADTLAQMKPTAVLINTARGSLVDEDALYQALTTGRLWAAGLDVFQEEPIPANHPFLKLDNVLLCPHTGGIDEESEYAMCTMAAQCVVDLYQGRWPEGCVVNETIRPGWKW